MCEGCNTINASVTDEDKAELRDILSDLSELEAMTAMATLEEGGIPVPAPATVGNDPIKALHLLAETHTIQVAVAAREACIQVEKFQAELSEVFGVPLDVVESLVSSVTLD